MNAPTRLPSLALALSLALAVAGPAPLAAKVAAPGGPELTRFVRVDVLSSAVAEGLAAAVPVDLLPVALVRDEQALRYQRLYLPPSFAKDCELVKRAGGWVAVEKGAQIPISLFECTFPRAFGPVLKAVIRSANSNVFSDLDLGQKLELLGIAGFGPKGQDLSSVLRIPLRAPATTISKGFQLIFSKPFESPDPDKFQVSGVDMAMAQFLDGVGLQVPGEGYKAPLHAAKPDYDQAVQLLMDNTMGDFAPFAVTLRFRGGVSLRPSAPGQAAKSFAKNFAEEVGGPRAEPVYRVTYNNKAGRLGYQTVSTFSVPAMRTGTATATRMDLCLTPLTIGDPALAALALRRELARALRTTWLLYGCADTELVPAAHAESFREALLRSTLPLWEYMACDNALKGLEGVDAYPTVSPIVRRRLSDDFIKLRTYLESPPSRPSDKLGLPDCFAPAYPRILDRPRDHRYAKAVWTSWDQWGHKSPSRTVDALASTLAVGYTSNTPSVDPTASVTAYFGATSAAAVQTMYGVAVDRFRAKLTDLEWLAQGVVPLADPLALPSTPVSTATTLTPLIFPFVHLQDKLAGKRLVSLVRGQVPPKDLVQLPGIVAIDWGTWAGATGTTTAALAEPAGSARYVLPGDAQVATNVQGVLNSLWAQHTPKDSAKFTYLTTDGFNGKSSVMETQLTSSAEPARLQARHYFHQRGNKALNLLMGRLKECLKQPQVSLLAVRPRKDAPKLMELVDLGSRGSTPGTSSTTDTPGALLPAAMLLAYDFIDRVALQDTAQTPAAAAATAKSMKAKNKLLDDLRKKVLIEPHLVPANLLSKYLSEASYPIHSLVFHLEWAAKLLGVQLKFYQRAAGTGGASRPVTPYAVPASPRP